MARQLDRSMTGRFIRTAPIPTPQNSSAIKSAGLLAEIEAAERRLRQRGNRLSNAVTDAWIEGVAAPTRGGKVAAGVRQAFKEIQLDGVRGELKLGQYLCKKLRAASQAGILDPTMDVELLTLRAIIRRLNS